MGLLSSHRINFFLKTFMKKEIKGRQIRNMIFSICSPDGGTKMGGLEQGHIGECAEKSGNGVIPVGCSLCMQVLV